MSGRRQVVIKAALHLPPTEIELATCATVKAGSVGLTLV